MKLSKSELNFLPTPETEALFSLDFKILLGVVFTLIAMMGIASSQQMKLSKMKRQAMTFKSKNVNQQRQIAALKAEFSSSAEANKARAAIEKETKTTTVWARYYKEVSLLIPKSVWIEKMKIKKHKGKHEIVIRGKATSQEKVSLFYDNLTKSKYYKSLLMSYSEVAKDFKPELIRFEFATSGFFQVGRK